MELNILFFHDGGILPYHGGVSRIFYNLMTEFRAQGNNVYALGWRGQEEMEYGDNQLFLPVKEKKICESNLSYAIDFVQTYNISVIVNQTDDFVFAIKQRMPDIRVISSYHGSITTNYKNYAYQIERQLREHHLAFLFKILCWDICRWAIVKIITPRRRKEFETVLEFSDKLVTLSPGHCEELQSVLRTPSDKVVVIPNCISTNAITNVRKEKLILWVGRVDTRIKRIDYMLDVWEMFSPKSDWVLAVLGDGPDLAWAKREAEKRNLKNIRFKGRVNPDAFYAKASISCVTSSHESFSMIILESYLNGVVPIVNDSYPSAKYLINDGNTGKLVRMFDKIAFVKALEELTQNPEMLSSMSSNALREAEKYRADAIYKEWLKILQ